VVQHTPELELGDQGLGFALCDLRGSGHNLSVSFWLMVGMNWAFRSQVMLFASILVKL
jgi:hypothetical protein